MVAKRRTTLAYKGRLCARSDLIKPEIPTGPDAPTVTRCAPNLILCLVAVMKYESGVFDISFALTQSELARPEGRISTRVPAYLKLPWAGCIVIDREAKKNDGVGLSTHRPRYGTSCAPMRWFSTISASFRQRKWRQLESDPCVFGPEDNDLAIGIAALHVEDISFDSIANGRVEFGEISPIFDSTTLMWK